MEGENVSNNLKDDLEDLREKSIFEITSDIKEVVLTSKGEVSHSSIIIKPRNRDLLIEINNLKINAKEQIAIDFRGGIENNYKSVLKFSGENEIISEGNIAICVSNNQTVEICGDEAAELKVISGKNMPAIGNNEYTAGAGHIVFSQKGSINLEAGNRLKESSAKMPWRGKDGAYALGFYNENQEKSSSIEILDEINLLVKGEKGESIKSISYENMAGNGGAAIKLNKGDLFNKESTGYLELVGGMGGGCEGEYCCGKCGDGGSAIAIESGDIVIKAPAKLRAGNGGSFSAEVNCIMAKGGNGGSGILFYGVDELSESKLKLGEEVEIIAGDGGNSSFYLNDTGVTAIEGGNGGNCLMFIKDKAKLFLQGEIKGIVGNGGKGSCEEEPCISGEVGKEIVGDNIEVIVMENEDIFEETKEKIEMIYEEPISNIEDDQIEENKTVADQQMILEDSQLKEEDKTAESNLDEIEVKGNENEIEKNQSNKEEGLAIIYQEKQSSKSYNFFVRIIKKILDFFKL